MAEWQSGSWHGYGSPGEGHGASGQGQPPRKRVFFGNIPATMTDGQFRRIIIQTAGEIVHCKRNAPCWSVGLIIGQACLMTHLHVGCSMASLLFQNSMARHIRWRHLICGGVQGGRLRHVGG